MESLIEKKKPTKKTTCKKSSRQIWVNLLLGIEKTNKVKYK